MIHDRLNKIRASMHEAVESKRVERDYADACLDIVETTEQEILSRTQPLDEDSIAIPIVIGLVVGAIAGWIFVATLPVF